MTLHYKTWTTRFTGLIYVRMNCRELMLTHKRWPLELVEIEDRP